MTQTEALKLARRAINNLIASSHLKDPQPWRDARQDSVDALTAIEKALAHPEQEPTNIERHERNVQKFLGEPQPKEPGQHQDWCASLTQLLMSMPPKPAPCNCKPSQRTWVGLEPEDRLCAKYMQDAPDGIEAVIDYIEAKLNEKITK